MARKRSRQLDEVCVLAQVNHQPLAVGGGGDLDAVLEVLTDPEPWRERGLRRAAQFTWEHTARAHEDVYRELL